MLLTFLEAGIPLTKTIRRTNSGLVYTPYPNVSRLTSHNAEVSSIESFYEHLVYHGAQNHALLKGALQRPITNESRRSLKADEETEWLCLDFDGLEGLATIDGALDLLGLSDTSYILQHSASSTLKPGLRAHVFMLLNTPTRAEVLNSFLMYLNLTKLRPDQITQLTASGADLKWPIDIRICEDARIIYIAPPICIGFDDPISERISLQIRANERLALPDVPPHETLQSIRHTILARLREQAGLPAFTPTYTFSNKHEVTVMRNPPVARVTQIKQQGEFTRLNLNGGDSWAYWHYTDKPHVIYNYKGEPNYLTQHIAPDYLAQAVAASKRYRNEQHKPKDEAQEPQFFVFTEEHSSRYFTAAYDPITRHLSINPAASLKFLSDFCALHNVPVPDPVPIWRVIFDPTSTTIVDSTNLTLNLYAPTPYRVNAENPDLLGTVEPYLQLIKFVVANDEPTMHRFLNWLAYIWQTGKKPKTAWVLQGTTGTGKGLLQRVLVQLFGPQIFTTSASFLTESFNTGLKTAQLLWVDEADTDSFNSKTIEPKLKTWITEDTITIREMHKAPHVMPSYFGVIFASNMRHAALVQHDDRRFNVAGRQEEPLLPPPSFIDDLFDTHNLAALANFLHSYVIDEAMVRTPMINDAKQEMQEITTDVPYEIVKALKTGDLRYFSMFLDEAPTNNLYSADQMDYKNLLRDLITQIVAIPEGEEARVKLTRLELTTLFQYLAGWGRGTPQPAAKFNKSLQRYGLNISSPKARIWRDGRSLVGLTFTFKHDSELIREVNQTLSTTSNVVPIRVQRASA